MKVLHSAALNPLGWSTGLASSGANLGDGLGLGAWRLVDSTLQSVPTTTVSGIKTVRRRSAVHRDSSTQRNQHPMCPSGGNWDRVGCTGLPGPAAIERYRGKYRWPCPPRTMQTDWETVRPDAHSGVLALRLQCRSPRCRDRSFTHPEIPPEAGLTATSPVVALFQFERRLLRRFFLRVW